MKHMKHGVCWKSERSVPFGMTTLTGATLKPSCCGWGMAVWRRMCIHLQRSQSRTLWSMPVMHGISCLFGWTHRATSADIEEQRFPRLTWIKNLDRGISRTDLWLDNLSRLMALLKKKINRLRISYGKTKNESRESGNGTKQQTTKAVYEVLHLATGYWCCIAQQVALHNSFSFPFSLSWFISITIYYWLCHLHLDCATRWRCPKGLLVCLINHFTLRSKISG